MENNVHLVNIQKEYIYYDETSKTYVIVEQAENPAEVATTIENTVQKLWNFEKTSVFINIVTEHQEDFKKSIKKVVWNKISTIITDIYKVKVNAQQCDTKWKCLVETYKKIKAHNEKSGNNHKEWPYFEAMDNVLAKKPEINPLVKCSSNKGLEFQSKPITISHSSDDTVDSETTGTEFFGKCNRYNKYTKKRKALDLLEKRHQEKMARQDRFLDLFEQLVNKIKDDQEKE
ncbi:hypothetical protein ABEB36_000384 [Hypothenemus hampei]|uniref:Myb/SANT-like DNA-binding domain-containing protein n=1 Tax=Hypothenemus hampei TaxID=57062 RepID=A0ABD1FB42_HYPHA